MNQITITTPDNIEIEYRLGGVGSRTAAAMLDFLIILLVSGVLTIILFQNVFTNVFVDHFWNQFSDWTIALILLLYFLIFFGYFIISELILKGQTIGKKLLHLRVIRENGMSIGFLQSVIRNLFRYFLDLFGFGVIMIFFHRKCKRIGDLVASTIVVIENSEKVSHLELSAAFLNKKPSKQTVIPVSQFPLTDEEYRLLENYFDRKSSFMDSGKQVRQALAAYLANKFSLSEEQLNEEALYKIFQLNTD